MKNLKEGGVEMAAVAERMDVVRGGAGDRLRAGALIGVLGAERDLPDGRLPLRARRPGAGRVP